MKTRIDSPVILELKFVYGYFASIRKNETSGNFINGNRHSVWTV